MARRLRLQRRLSIGSLRLTSSRTFITPEQIMMKISRAISSSYSLIFAIPAAPLSMAIPASPFARPPFMR